jgi:low temperature requirement protein LtrA
LLSRGRPARSASSPRWKLFFDLVYVFAIGQLSHHLLEHVDLRTATETAIMTLAGVYAWYMVAWGRTGWTRTGWRCGWCWSG